MLIVKICFYCSFTDSCFNSYTVLIDSTKAKFKKWLKQNYASVVLTYYNNLNTAYIFYNDYESLMIVVEEADMVTCKNFKNIIEKYVKEDK